MWSTIRKFIPTIVSIIFWVGLQMSGIVIPWLGYLLMGLAVVLLLIPGWSLVKRVFSNISRLRLILKPVQGYKDVSTRFALRESNPREEMQLADRSRLRELLVVRNERLLSWKLDTDMGGELQFGFDVFNGSVVPIKIGHSVEGNLFIEGKKCHDQIEPLKFLNLAHGIVDTITIKQRILPEVVKKIRDGASQLGGIILSFDFHDVHIRIEEDSTIQGVSLQNNLNILGTMKFRVKHEAGIYSWQRLCEVNVL